jgi:ATP-dependent helicase/nuclease subunit B
LGWPGGRSLNSQEYQLISRWQELLAEFRQLDDITGAVTRHIALNGLRDLIGQTIFQPKTSLHANIQVLGLLESSGFYFDALWVMGMDQQNWPPQAKPNPFLPYSLQIARQTPHCSAQRELHYSLKITQRLLYSAQSIWISCSAREPDQPAQFSRLIPQAQPAEVPAMEGNPLLKMLATGRTEPLSECYGPKISTTEKIHGGSGIFTRQAECPFRAFATYRLHAMALATPELGISKKKHGILIHSALEKLWKILRNQQHLLALSQEQLIEQIATVIDEVLAAELITAERPFAPIEKQRLLSIVTEWLTLEKKRPPFKILEQETTYSVDIAGLKVRLQIDRIDELADGSRMLLDYKTSPTQIQAWLHERLLQPQLPLYTLSTAENYFAGVAFAQLYAGKVGFNGLHAEYLDTEHYFPAGVMSVADYKKDLTAPKTWEALLSQWREILQKLAISFQSGYAKVDPADQGIPCKTCDLSTLCRIKL